MTKTAAQRQRECRKRKRDIVTPENVTCVTKEPERDMPERKEPTLVYDPMDKTVRPTLEHYQLNPGKYVPRREPDKMNWGPWMNSQQLAAAGLKGNRVTLPGDWDYVGVCYQDADGTWKVGKDTRTLDQLSDVDLQLKLKSYEGASWMNSPEHKEVLRRKQAAGACL